MFSPFVTGLRMKKVADDAQDLLTWQDGTVAVGMHKIGKGAIIEFGAKGDSGGAPLPRLVPGRSSIRCRCA